MHGDVIGLVAPNLELRLFLARVARIAFVLRVAGVDLDYPAGYTASLRIPANMVADFKVLAHGRCAYA